MLFFHYIIESYMYNSNAKGGLIRNLLFHVHESYRPTYSITLATLKVAPVNLFFVNGYINNYMREQCQSHIIISLFLIYFTIKFAIFIKKNYIFYDFTNVNILIILIYTGFMRVFVERNISFLLLNCKNDDKIKWNTIKGGCF